MARLLPKQLEFDFFAPPTEQAKKPEKRAVSAAFNLSLTPKSLGP